MTIQRTLLMLSVALSGCQYLGDPDQFRVEHLDQSQVAEVKSAMREWNAALDGAQELELNEDGGSIVSVTDWNSDAAGDCVSAGPSGSRIRVKPGLTSIQFRNVVLHELGHHLGCFHGDGVMAPDSEREIVETLTQDDIDCAKTIGAKVL